MRKSIGAVVFVAAVIVAGAVAAQGVLVDAAADKVIKKYQAATCDQLKAQKTVNRFRNGMACASSPSSWARRFSSFGTKRSA